MFDGLGLIVVTVCCCSVCVVGFKGGCVDVCCYVCFVGLVDSR